MTANKFFITLPLTLTLGLVGCGGGGSSSSSNTPPSNSNVSGANNTSAPAPVNPAPSTGDPVPPTNQTPSDTSTSNVDTAMDCFDTLAATPGTKYEETTHQITSGSQKTDYQFSHTSINQGETTYNGSPAIRYSVVSNYGGQDSPSEDYYSAVDVANKRITELGYGGGTGSTTTYVPGYLHRFDLKKGESYTQTYVEKTQFPSSYNMAPTESYPLTEKATYVGKELVTVPAGQFTACKFLIEGTATDDRGGVHTWTDTLWVSKGSGKTIKYTSSSSGNLDEVEELVSAKVNGVPIQ